MIIAVAVWLTLVSVLQFNGALNSAGTALGPASAIVAMTHAFFAVLAWASV